jgi:thiol-disulfide isomerase/thioredoxin
VNAGAVYLLRENKMGNLIMYYGENCPYCHVMMPILDKLKKKEKINITKKEVWNNDENADEMRKHSQLIMDACEDGLGVPAFFSIKTNDALCGEITYDELKEWAMRNK